METTATAFSDRLTVLEQENAALRMQLQTCEQTRAVLSPAMVLQPAMAVCPNSSFCNSQSSKIRPADPESLNPLLQAIAIASNALLTVTDLTAALDTALRVIGEAVDTDRVVVIENFCPDSDATQLHWRVLQEWDAADIHAQIADSELVEGSWVGIESWYEQLSQGQSISCLLDEMPEPFRTGQAKLGVKALHVVPIFVAGRYWGQIGFDDCREAKYRDAAELAVLQIVGNCLGSAIQRDRTQKAILQAEQTRVAELVKANEALRQSLNTLAADPDLERFIGHTLTHIALQFDSPLTEYWTQTKASDNAQIHLIYWQGNVLQPAQQADHPGNHGVQIPLDLLNNEFLQPHQRHILHSGICNSTNAICQQFRKQSSIDIASWYTAHGVTQLLNLPLRIGDQVIGVLAIYLPSDRTFAASSIELAHTLIQQLALAIQLTQLAEEAKHAAIFEERNRLASEIHDTLAQAFTGISLQLEVAKPLIEQEPQTVQRILDHLSQLAQSGLSEARRSVWALYPPAEEYADLAQMLYHSVEQMSRNTAISIAVNLHGTPCPLSPQVGLNLLRIGQEALTNAIKHAQPLTITIELTYEQDRVSLLIRDDGCGFNPPTTLNSFNGGFGLVGMYERCDRIGAQITLTSQLGQGTQIFIEAPLA